MRGPRPTRRPGLVPGWNQLPCNKLLRVKCKLAECSPLGSLEPEVLRECGSAGLHGCVQECAWVRNESCGPANGMTTQRSGWPIPPCGWRLVGPPLGVPAADESRQLGPRLPVERILPRLNSPPPYWAKRPAQQSPKHGSTARSARPSPSGIREPRRRQNAGRRHAEFVS
jgi:hypothetical protein